MEGLLGGLATGTLVVIGVSFGLLNDWSLLAIGVFLLSLLTIIMSVFGDLFEKYAKAPLLVSKDAGALLPGHGMFLTVIDSQLSAVPILRWGFGR